MVLVRFHARPEYQEGVTHMKKIIVRKAGTVRLTARCSNYCYGNCCCL
jgi:hypothetical protein